MRNDNLAAIDRRHRQVHTGAMLIALLISAAAPAASPEAAAQPDRACQSQNPSEAVVCGRSKDPYRIDPAVLQAQRARDAVPAKPEAGAEAAEAPGGCIGPMACGGDFVPLVAVGLKTLEAATLAAKGEDWREAFRTREDEYRLYQQAQERRAQERRPKVRLEVGNSK